MKTGIAVVLACIAAPAVLAGAIPDSLIYGQSPVAFETGFESSVAASAAFPSQRVADTIGTGFGLPLPSRVFRIDWWGGVDNIIPGFDLSNIESFSVRAYSLFDDEIFYEETFAMSDLDVELEFDNLGTPAPPVFRFSYQSNQGLLFYAAETGYISIAANYVDGGVGQPRFLWAPSVDGDDELFTVENGVFFPLAAQFPNTAYALYGAVPTPGAFALLGLAGLAAARRRR